jgi:hypothetical protein
VCRLASSQPQGFIAEGHALMNILPARCRGGYVVQSKQGVTVVLGSSYRGEAVWAASDLAFVERLCDSIIFAAPP